MVESSAAARKSFLLSLREKKTPLLRTNSDKRKGGTYIYISGISDALFRKKAGPLYNPLGQSGDCPAVHQQQQQQQQISSRRGPSDQAGIADFCLTRDLQKKKKQPAALNCLLFRHGGEEGSFSVSPRDIRWPFTHRGTIVCLFDSLFKLDADRIALDMCIATKKNQQQRKKKKNVNDGHFKYFYLSKHPFY